MFENIGAMAEQLDKLFARCFLYIGAALFHLLLKHLLCRPGIQKLKICVHVFPFM